MTKYKVLGGRWGEGHKPGDIIDLDDEAAKVRLQICDIEFWTPLAEEVAAPVEPQPAIETPLEKLQSKSREVKCQLCGSKTFRHKIGCPNKIV